MSPAGHLLSPTSSLPLLRSITLTSEQIFSALDNLHELYFPVSLSRAVTSQFELGKVHDDVPVEPIDSGYASEDGDIDGHEQDIIREDALDALRADDFERNFAIRWLTTLIARADELPLSDDDERERAVDKASYVLASFSKTVDEEDEDDTGLIRNFSFALDLSSNPSSPETSGRSVGDKVAIDVRLNDISMTTHSDVGLQTWGASVVFSDLICASPARFGFTRPTLGSSSRIIELGAGTGLVSLVLAKALPFLGITNPTVIATDHHPTVLANLEINALKAGVQTCALDWSAPVLEAPLDSPADMLIATDVIYDLRHAQWLRACATHLLAPGGVFWLLMTVRPSGRHGAVVHSVESAFQGVNPQTPDGRYLEILDIENVEKLHGVGRGDESGYKLFRIGWA
ncbi:uncharacterized protein GGS22DRAFT_164739 [Annulohypoxylon maeteangense]|uniref:uncharacterized protein n=1 Tax=Annulohypoxylon maeteangense TaxID=1927788 RepID=UPI0020072304|nr:uncharacterized protein GGS22DRAFT_164739 [Annulohypoxylon maeteangense]KAI0884047.1 hypothetical protein GGS22DRAFT_164739 [Annulohypoxylon maeteangense]